MTSYPCVRMQDRQSIGVIVVDFGPQSPVRKRFRLPTEREAEALPSGPDLTAAELRRITRADRLGTGPAERGWA